MEDREILNTLIRSELDCINNEIIKKRLKNILIDPVQHVRKWDYGKNKESFICWTVGVDDKFDTSIIYSDFGFGPENPWGLVSNNTESFGMDTGWFSSLVDCFLDSKMANELTIWELRKINGNSVELIEQNLSLYDAFVKRDKISLHNPQFKYEVLPNK